MPLPFIGWGRFRRSRGRLGVDFSVYDRVVLFDGV